MLKFCCRFRARMSRQAARGEKVLLLKSAVHAGKYSTMQQLGGTMSEAMVPLNLNVD